MSCSFQIKIITFIPNIGYSQWIQDSSLITYFPFASPLFKEFCSVWKVWWNLPLFYMILFIPLYFPPQLKFSSWDAKKEMQYINVCAGVSKHCNGGSKSLRHSVFTQPSLKELIKQFSVYLSLFSCLLSGTAVVSKCIIFKLGSNRLESFILYSNYSY